jgi:hypothetical protein
LIALLKGEFNVPGQQTKLTVAPTLGTSVPTSLFTIDQRVRDLRYRRSDVEASSPHSDGYGVNGLAANQPETADEHKAHVEAFLKVQSEYSQLTADLGDMFGQVFSGSVLLSIGRQYEVGFC